MSRLKPLSQAQITELVDECLDIKISFLKTEQPAHVLAQVNRSEQDFIQSWIQRIASTKK